MDIVSSQQYFIVRMNYKLLLVTEQPEEMMSSQSGRK